MSFPVISFCYSVVKAILYCKLFCRRTFAAYKRRHFVGCCYKAEGLLFYFSYTFGNTDGRIDWCYLRKPDLNNYELSKDKYILKGTELTLDDVDSPTFMALRQRDFNMTLTTDVKIDCGYAGVTMYMCEDEHYDLFIRKKEDCYEAVLKLNIGGIKHEQAVIPLDTDKVTFKVIANNYSYSFFVVKNGKEINLGYGNTKYLTSEVSGGFTGTMTAIFAVGNNTAEFTDFECRYN